VIHLVDEAEERLVSIVERRCLDVAEDAGDEVGIAEQFRRNCGVGLDSKRTEIALRRIRGDQLAQSGTERRRAAKDLLREAREMLGGRGEIREEVPDLRILGILPLHLFDQGAVWPRLRMAFDVRKEHWLHWGLHRGHLIDDSIITDV